MVHTLCKLMHVRGKNVMDTQSALYVQVVQTQCQHHYGCSSSYFYPFPFYADSMQLFILCAMVTTLDVMYMVSTATMEEASAVLLNQMELEQLIKQLIQTYFVDTALLEVHHLKVIQGCGGIPFLHILN